MKKLVYLVVAFLMFSCSSDDPVSDLPDEEQVGGENNGNPNGLKEVDRTADVWTVVKDSRIGPVADSHHSRVWQAGVLDGQRIHRVGISTGYQYTEDLMFFNDNTWSKFIPTHGYIYGMDASAGVFGAGVRGKRLSTGLPEKMFAREYNSATKKFDEYEQEGLGKTWSDIEVLYAQGAWHALVHDMETHDIFDYVWDANTKLWTEKAQLTPTTRLIPDFAAIVGQNGEIIITGKENTNETAYNQVAYLYKGGEFTEFYREDNFLPGRADNRPWHMVLVNNEYYVVSAGGITNVATGESFGGNVMAHTVTNGKLVVLYGTLGALDTTTITGVSVFDFASKEHIILGIDNDGSDLDSGVGGPQDPRGWSFYIEGNELHMIANTNQGVGGATGRIVTDAYHYKISL